MPLSQWSTTVEIRLKRLPIYILPSSRLLKGGEAIVPLDKEYQIQLGKRCKYNDLKKRIVDCINASKSKFGIAETASQLADTDIRLWKFADQKEVLLEKVALISNQPET